LTDIDTCGTVLGRKESILSPLHVKRISRVRISIRSDNDYDFEKENLERSILTMLRTFVLLLLGTLVFGLPCVVTAASLPISIPMNQQINVGQGNAITGPGALSFQPANPGAGEPDGWCKNPIPGGVDGPRIDLTKAGLGSVDISDPNTVMEVDVRIYHEHEYNDAGMVLMLRDTSNRWRNYGYNTPGGLNSYLHDNNWSHRTYVLNDYARQAWDLGGSNANFDPTHVNYITWSASDWQNTGNDWTGAKKLVIRIADPPPTIGAIKALPLHSPVTLWAMPVSYTATLAGAPANSYF
jgi:hypothetical protein